MKISVGDVEVKTLLKAIVQVIQALVTVGVLIWYTAGWKNSVDHRLDDIDRDLKSIHEHYEHQSSSPLSPIVDDNDLPRISRKN